MSKKVKLIILALSFFGAIAAANLALAADFGVDAVNNGLAGSLNSTDPRILAGRIIQIALSFLGAIAVVIVMSAGFLWMTSNGDEEKITRAKAILKNALIGLIIILAAWGITTFVITRLMGAIGGDAGGGYSDGGKGGFSTPGIGAIGACSIDSAYPESGQQEVPRNTSIMVTFKETVKTDTLCVNGSGDTCACDKTDCTKINPEAIRIYKTDLGDACSASCPNPNGNATDVLVNVASDGKTLILTPASFLGSADGNTSYSVKLTNKVRKLDDSSMFKNCASDFASWQFTVSNKLDLIPPIVSPAGIFPLPDNSADIYKEVTPAEAASGAISVEACPQVYSEAQVISVNPKGAQVALDYHGAISKFKISVPAGAPDKAQLFDGNDTLLGIADFKEDGTAIFKDYLTITSALHPEGSLWTVDIAPEKLADTLAVNEIVYTFAASAENNNIKVPAVCDKAAQAFNIQAKLSGNPDIDVTRTGSKINISAKVAGQNGNNIALTTTNNSALAITPLSGGLDRQESNQARDKKDRPMNSAIQINFAEAINPVTISGSATEVDKYIRVVNASASSSPAGTACNNDNQCRSYNCDNNSCIGNYIGGKFMVSNGYKTLEFVSDRECGMNGCGEKIYCLPANSHLSVELVAANLKVCGSDNDCAAFSPFKTCSPTPYGYKTCQNSAGQNYPAANLSSLDGIVDAAVNSLDGARNGFADGPLNFYNDNYPATSTENLNKQDKYKWSFYINDQIMLSPPQITSISPTQGQGNISLADPIEATFNTLMMNSTLRTGSTIITSGTSTIEHKLINLRSSSPSPFGYWILNDNKDLPPLDGEPDITIAKIWHSPFAESATFKAQIGSGVKDIYQNCYKPSLGPNCPATAEQPSCCFGTPTSTLGSNGSCQ